MREVMLFDDRWPGKAFRKRPLGRNLSIVRWQAVPVSGEVCEAGRNLRWDIPGYIGRAAGD